MKSPRVLLVTDPAYTESLIESVVLRVGSGLSRGELGVLLRDKQRSRAAVVGFAERLRKATSSVGAPLIVHSDVSLALAVKADGIHLGGEGVKDEAQALTEVRRALPGGWISVATHDDADVERAAREGADAVLVSPIYETPGKGPVRGVAAIASARAHGPKLFVYALGGVDARRAPECRKAGADGIALIRALLAATDPLRVARAIDAALLAKID